MGRGHSRTAALLLAGAVLAAACGTDSSEDVVDGASTTTLAPVASAPGDTPPPAVGEEPSATTPSGAPAAPGAPPADPADPAPADPGPGEAAPLAPAGPVGSLAVRYLRPAASERILIQVLAQEGAGPAPAVIERTRQVLADVSGKPVGVATAGVEGGARTWTSEQLVAVADASSAPQTAEQAVLTLLFVHGGFAGNERAVGVAVRGDVAAVFAERVDEAAGMLGDRGAVEDAVTLHEVGHLLGLVDLVVDTDRADPEHPGHSPNEGSVMYYAVESTLLGSVLAGGPPRDFDQADLDELARIRNG